MVIVKLLPFSFSRSTHPLGKGISLSQPGQFRMQMHSKYQLQLLAIFRAIKKSHFLNMFMLRFKFYFFPFQITRKKISRQSICLSVC